MRNVSYPQIMRYRALATDYDGTLAEQGRIDVATWAALRALRASGRHLLVVTGRELDELLELVDSPELFDRIVAENGAVLYAPGTRHLRTLAAAPPRAFVPELRRRGVSPLAAGRVIVATRTPHLKAVRQVIADLRLDLEITLNKEAVMVLPPGVDKASGLAVALPELGLAPAEVVAVGDAENDHAMLELCGVGAAVANAIPELRATAAIVTIGDHGSGVSELIGRLLTDGSLD